MDVIEENGFDVSHRCYWDFGRWSDLCRVWRPAGDDSHVEEAVNFEVGFKLLSHVLHLFLCKGIHLSTSGMQGCKGTRHQPNVIVNSDYIVQCCTLASSQNNSGETIR